MASLPLFFVCLLYFFFSHAHTHSLFSLFAKIKTSKGWVFPYLIRSHSASQFSLVPALGGWLVTVTHGYLNAKWFSHHGKHLTASAPASSSSPSNKNKNSTNKWLRNPRFLAGLVLYYGGFALLVWHDHILRSLRDPNDHKSVSQSVSAEAFFMY
jgi:3-oxo-5-alpha-steroid 4-dehydrogenase 1